MIQKKNGFANVLLIVLVVVLAVLVGVGWYVIVNNGQSDIPGQCTLEAFICPDGSSVGRTGPNCEFAPCTESQSGTENWKMYRNEELGLSFRYPQNWGDINLFFREGLSDAYPSGKGKSMHINFANSSISIAAYTTDFAGYAEIPYAGDKDLTTLCKKPLTVIEGQTSVVYCNRIIIDNQPIYNEIRIGMLPEGDGSFRLTQEALVNLQGKTFKGLSVSQDFSEVDSELIAGEVHAPKVYLEKILARQVSQNVLSKMNIFEQFIGTFQF